MKNITDPVDNIKDPYELARIVEEVIIGDFDVLMVTTDSLLDLLVNKFPTPAETIKFLKFLCLYNSRNEDAAFLWCKFAMYLVPENSRRKMCELPEYVNKDCQDVWNRLFGKISAVVSNQEYSAFRLQNYYSRVTKGTEDYLLHKRPRMKKISPAMLMSTIVLLRMLTRPLKRDMEISITKERTPAPILVKK